MPSTVFESTIPMLVNGLASLKHIVEVGEKYATEKSLPESDILDARLVDDMLPFHFQIHIATDTAQKAVARLEGTEPKPWTSNLTSFAGVYKRIADAQAILAAAKPAAWASRDEEPITVPMGKDRQLTMPAKDYIITYNLPNFFFHLQTAYAILRAKGLPLGKSDYLGSFMAKYEAK